MQEKDVIVRPATIEDFDALLVLNKKLFESDYVYDSTLNMEWTYSEAGKNYFQSLINDDDKFAFVAEQGGKFIAYIAGGVIENSPYRITQTLGEVFNMYTEQEYRSKGVGKSLMEVSLNWFKEKNVNRVRVVASAKNERAITFYQRSGFIDYDLALEMDI